MQRWSVFLPRNHIGAQRLRVFYGSKAEPSNGSPVSPAAGSGRTRRWLPYPYGLAYALLSGLHRIDRLRSRDASFLASGSRWTSRLYLPIRDILCPTGTSEKSHKLIVSAASHSITSLPRASNTGATATPSAAQTWRPADTDPEDCSRWMQATDFCSFSERVK